MSRALSIRHLLILLLVSLAKIQAYVSRTNENETVTVKPVISELSEATTVRYEDQDPAESSETIVYNRFEDPPEDDEEDPPSEEEPEGPDHEIPYSEHEEPRNVPTKPKYNAPGEWAKPARVRDVPQEDAPLKLLAQVRRTHTVRRLPRKKAIENAESDEERLNAARLREVVRNTKVNTVYTEEGYEDSAYDHAGHIRDADFHEGYARKLHDQMDLKKSQDDKDGRGENSSAKIRKLKKIDPEEFKDYDEDYKDYHETTTGYKKLVDAGANDGEDVWSDPKVVTEEGIQKLQVDLDKEAEEMEKLQDSIDRENLAESRKNSNYQKKQRKGKGKKKPISLTEPVENPEENPNENLEEFPEDQNNNIYIENYSTTGAPIDEEIATEGGPYTTIAAPEALENSPGDSSGLYRYQVEGNLSPYTGLIDFQRAENPTTINYSQLFWNYFKARQNLFSTIQPLALEATTLSPNLLQGASFLQYGFAPVFREQATSFPITESSILTPQRLVASQSLANSKYASNPVQNHIASLNEIWQPITTTESPVTDRSQLQTISLSDSIRNVASQESTKTFDNPFLNALSSFTSQPKPRYKITIRHKQKKPTDSVNSPNQELSSPINATPSESPARPSDNYMKVLTHLRNEDSGKNLYSAASPGSFLSSIRDESKDLTRMRPPAPQKAAEVGYQNFLPRKPVENESPKTPSHGHQRAPIAYNLLPGARQSQGLRKRNSMPATDLQPPLASSASEYVRYKEADYLTDAGNWLKQSRNVIRPFRQASIGFDAISRAKRRERRSAGGREDEGHGVVKVEELVANNGESNRGEADRAAKNRWTERNSRMVGGEGGNGIDKPVARKRSRSGIDLGRGVLGSRRESTHDETESGFGSEESLEESKDTGGGLEISTAVERKSIQKRSINKASHEELLNESPKITDEVVSREIDTRFNENHEEDGTEANDEKKVEVEVPDFDYVEELPEEDPPNNAAPTESTLDLKKYPFYKDEKLPSPSALRYATDPGRIPRKTYGGMEFYDSRDAYKHCDEVEPKLDVLPKKEEPVADKGPNENQPRIRGLGDKLDCYKAKYFDEDPFDNPLFLEKEVDEPETPDFGAKQFASRIMLFPKEDEDYVVQKSSKRPESYSRQRRPDPNKVVDTSKPQKPRIIRYKSYPRSTRPSRPRVYRIRSSKTRYVKARRPQKVIKRPIGSASEVSSFYMPYQNQVYEDVMGTIKNMANSYKVYESSTSSSSSEAEATDKESKEDTDKTKDKSKTNSTANSTSREEKGKDSVSIDIVEHPNNNVDINIEGLKPPKNLSRHRPVHRRNRIPQNGKMRFQKPLPNLRPVNYRKKIRIYKRDARDGDGGSIEITSMDKDDRMKFFFDSEESKEDSKERIEKFEESKPTTEAANISLEDSTETITSVPVSKVPISKRKSKVPKPVSVNVSCCTDENPKKEPSKKVYTIRDRIRYSKPKAEVKNVGKFVNETKEEVDVRRNEPKYNYIRRRKPSTLISTTPEPFTVTTIIVPDSTNENLEANHEELAKENRKIQYVDKNIEVEQLDSPRNSESNPKTSLELSESQTLNKTKGYDVHENVNETTTLEPPEMSRLKAFLESDTSGYPELSAGGLKSSYLPQSNSSKDFIANLESIESKESSEPEDNASKSFQKSSFPGEDSSEKGEINTKDQPGIESSEEANASSKGSGSEEDRTFFKYGSRPTSPAENYEDEKYSALGPRINKPEFFHPPFSFSSYSRFRPKGSSEEDSKEAEESDEEKEEYIFPWYRDRKHKKGKDDRYRSKSVSEYEYPWERRERLAEETRRKERKRKRLAESLEDEDEDASTRKYRRNAYPRGRYRFWTRMKENSSEEDASDNIESSSEHKPVMKFSSRYSKNATLPLNENSTTVRSKSVEEISKSITRALEGDSTENSKEKKYTGPLRNRGASRGIIPEDVTLPPTRRNNRKEISKSSASNSTVAAAARNLLKNEEKGHRNSNTLTRNTVDNSESRLTVLKTNGVNSTNEDFMRQSKKRRRPLKNIVSLIESTTKAVVEGNRSRRRQKPAVSTPDTATSTSSTTPAPMTVKRKHPKSVKDLKTVPKIEDKKGSEKNKTDTSVLKNGTLEHRSGDSKKKTDKSSSETIEKSVESKDTKNEELQKKDSKKNDIQRKITKSDSPEIKSKTKEKLDNNAGKIEETKFDEKSSTKDKDESFDSKDDSDFDRSDTIPGSNYDDEFGSVFKSDNRLEDSPPRTVPVMSVKSLRIEENRDSQDISGQKEDNGRKSVKIELLQGQEDEEKRNDSKSEGKKRESNAKFVKDPEQRLHYYIERRK